MTPALEKEGPVVSTSSKKAPEVSKYKTKGPQKKQKGPKNHQGKGTGKANWHKPYPQGYRSPKLEPSAMESVFNMARTLMEFTANEQERMKKTFANKYCKKYNFSNLALILDSNTKACDRIESKCQVKEDEIGDISISHINEKLAILRSQVLEIIHHNNKFDTHLKKSDSESQKLKNKIIANVETIHKNYEPHMPRLSTPLTEEKRSVKGSLTPILGNNPICEKEILNWNNGQHSLKTKINEAQVIEEVQCTEEKEESDLDSVVSEDKPVEDYPIENITYFFEVTEVLTHLPQYGEDCHNLINIQDARICKTKSTRGKGYTSGASCITSILIYDTEARVNLDTGEFCTCVGKDYLQEILPGWKSHLLPIEGVHFNSASNSMYPLGILDTNLVFPHPTGSIRMKKEIVVMDNCTSQHIILGNIYLNIYGIDINNHKDKYVTIGENERQKFVSFNMSKKIYLMLSVQDTYKEEFVENELLEAQINPSLSPKMRNYLIDVLYTFKNDFASDNEPVGSVKGNEVDITLNIDRPYTPVLIRPAYPASPRAREALEKHIIELIQLGVLRNVGHKEEVEVKTPVIIAWNNDKSRMVGDFGALNTYTTPYRYLIPRIQKTLTQLSKAKYITSMDALKGFHQNVLTPNFKKSIRSITQFGIYEYLRVPFGIKNAPSHYQRMMDTIFPTELSEGWLIIYIDDIIICSGSWFLHLERIARVLDKATELNMKISLKKCNFGFEEPQALGHIVSGLSLGIDKTKADTVLIKPIPQNIKEMMSFLGFASYYRKHLKDFVTLAKSVYRICAQQTVYEIKQEIIKAYGKIRKSLT
ncbi:hypothetical protein O181_033159 [Austropuccinia psidii MF-1]|uniref:Reverse transcriptase domain-containing protein n=1 Tax=Austropuccinia psidii MF-1 TaxID=1389203 RepID=A0A9Q3CYQ0_9BASI|nr:hypothetical protein [Austropuccinia psidii MF-1]